MHELAASLVEVTDRNGRWFFQVNSKKGTPSPPPVNIPRPWDIDEKPEPSTTDEVKAFFGTRRKR